MVAVVTDRTRRQKNWSALLGAQPGTCMFCEAELEATKTKGRRGRPPQVCAECREVFRAIRDAIRNILARQRCSICRNKAMPGETHCERHHHLPEPCICGARIVRRSGRGNQPKHCVAWPKCAKAKLGSATATGSTIGAELQPRTARV